jgi:deazaflavin-dependent oxidoreductase (nitroreductase family)
MGVVGAARRDRRSDMTDLTEHNRQLIEEFRATRSTNGAPLNGRPVVLLTTTGAKTGNRRTTPLMCIRNGERLLVIASNAGAPRHPDWYHNLVAHPDVMVEVDTESFHATAVVVEGPEREHLWAWIVEKYPFFGEHQAKVARQIPVVALERRKS